MSNQNGMTKYTSADLKGMLEGASVRRRFEKVLGDKATGFVTSVLQIINDSNMLSNASPNSVLNAAMTAATLDLPINPNLGFAYIIPYKNKSGTIAQFQMGYKGYIQLCQRTGLFKTISCAPIYEGQLINEDPLRGFDFDFRVKSSDKIIGYASFFSLLNGFEKTYYMSVDDVKAHANKYSQSYKKGYGVWKDDFDSMALKTVLKLLLSKYAPMTVDIETAIKADQSEVVDTNSMEVRYPDNEKPKEPIDTNSDEGPKDVQYEEKEEQLEGSVSGQDGANSLGNTPEPNGQQFEIDMSDVNENSRFGN